MKRLVIVALLMAGLTAHAWEPTKTIVSTIGFTPGSGNEIVFKTVAAQVEKNTGVKFVVINKPGAGSAVANEFIIKEPADGHHLLVGSVPALAATDRMLLPNKVYGISNWTYAMSLASNPMAIIAHTTDPVNSIQDLVKALKSEQINMGDPGSAARLTYELLVKHAKFIEGNKNVMRVEYKGPADTLYDIMGKQIRFGILPSLMTIVPAQSGKIKVVAITGTNTTPLLPGVVTMSSVFPDFDFALNIGIVLPQDTPQEVVQWYEREFGKALDSPEVKEIFARNLMFINKNLQNSKAFKAFVENEERRYKSIVDKVLAAQK